MRLLYVSFVRIAKSRCAAANQLHIDYFFFSIQFPYILIENARIRSEYSAFLTVTRDPIL
jgi:hypothetical protein